MQMQFGMQCPAGNHGAACGNQKHQGHASADEHYHMDKFLLSQHDHCRNYNDQHYYPKKQCIFPENIVFAPPD